VLSRDPLIAALQDGNVRAFLRVIRLGESTQDDARAYGMINGGGSFGPPFVHPYAGQAAPPGRAAGAYQFIPHTWQRLEQEYGFEDMRAEYQDQAAVALILEKPGALADVMAGRVGDACAKLHGVWTSLPGGSEQNHNLDHALTVFYVSGGVDGAPQPPAPVPEVPIAAPPQEKKPMFPIPLILAGLNFLASTFPAVANLVSTQGNVPERNIAIAGTLLDAATKATGSSNFQEAIGKIQSDPTAKAAAEEAIHAAIPGLIEVGGGVEAARKAPLGAYADEKPWRIFFTFPFLVFLILVTPTVLSVVSAAVFNFPFLMAFDAQTRGLIVGFVLGTLGASVVAFVYGTTQDSNRKTSLLANKE
jgi:muramidase (phage lysozyme)